MNKKELKESLEKLAREANFGNYKATDLYFVSKKALEKSIFQSTGKKVSLKSLEVPPEFKSYDISQKFRKNLRQSM